MDLEAPFQVTTVVLTAGAPGLRGASLYVGNDASGSVQANALMAVSWKSAMKRQGGAQADRRQWGRQRQKSQV